MTAYLDTSFLVSLLVAEAKSGSAVGWMRRQAYGTVHASDWSVTEVASALALKLRTGQIDARDRETAADRFEQLRRRLLVLLPVTSAHFEMAADLVARPGVALRAADALHCAVAGSAGLALFTFDKAMLAAGPALGVRTETLP